MAYGSKDVLKKHSLLCAKTHYGVTALEDDGMV